MGSLKFTNLPLVRVDLRMVLAEDLILDAPGILAIASAVREFFPDPHPMLVAAEGPPGPPRPITTSMDSVVAFNLASNPPGGVFTVQQNMLTCRWIKAKVRERGADREFEIEYPGYEKLKELFEGAITALMELGVPLSFSVVNMSYTNFEQNLGESVRKLVRTDFLNLTSPVGELTDASVNWRLETGHDYRLHVNNGIMSDGVNQFPGLQVINSSGIHVVGKEPFGELDSCHAKLIELFPKAISEETLHHWGYGHE